MPRQDRASISVGGKFYERLERWADEHDVPLSAIVEICAARAIGLPLSELPESVRQWADRLAEIAPPPR